MAVTITQSQTVTQGTRVSSQTLTFASPTTAGCAVLIVWQVQGTPTTTVLPTISDNNSGTYTTIADVPFASVTRCRVGAHIAANLAGRSGHIVTMTNSTIMYVTAKIYELAGVPTSALVSGTTVTNTGVVTTAVTSGSMTPADDGLHFAGMGYDGGATTITPNWSGATQDVELDEANAVSGPLSVLTKAAVTSSAENAGWTLAATRDWGAFNCALKATVVVGGGQPTTYYHQLMT